MRAPEILLRAGLASAAAVLLDLGFGKQACDVMRPVFGLFIEACVPGVVVRGLEVIRQGGVDLLVAVTYPAQAAQAAMIPPGAMIVSVTVGGSLAASKVALAVALAWPVVGGRDAGVRGITLAALLPLLMLVGPLTLAAEGVATLRDISGQEGVPALLVLSRLLMGGGSAALGLAAGMVAVLAGRRSGGGGATRRFVSLGAA